MQITEPCHHHLLDLESFGIEHRRNIFSNPRIPSLIAKVGHNSPTKNSKTKCPGGLVDQVSTDIPSRTTLAAVPKELESRQQIAVEGDNLRTISHKQHLDHQVTKTRSGKQLRIKKTSLVPLLSLLLQIYFAKPNADKAAAVVLLRAPPVATKVTTKSQLPQGQLEVEAVMTMRM
jgi:hypothetical protein